MCIFQSVCSMYNLQSLINVHTYNLQIPSANKFSTQLTCAKAFTIWYPRLLHKNIMSRIFSCLQFMSHSCWALQKLSKGPTSHRHGDWKIKTNLALYIWKEKRTIYIHVTFGQGCMCAYVLTNIDIAFPNAHSGAQLRKFSAHLLHQSRLNVPRFSPWRLLTAHWSEITSLFLAQLQPRPNFPPYL